MRIALVLILLTGCTSVSEKRDPVNCVDWRYYTTEKQECIGGRGVAPQLCVVKEVQRNVCVRWEE
tara:strand:- start:10 stop:204 length:195 start_codon:yes stop_codon:yes gene_type:complete